MPSDMTVDTSVIVDSNDYGPHIDIGYMVWRSLLDLINTRTTWHPQIKESVSRPVVILIWSSVYVSIRNSVERSVRESA
jgi:hypothetical protein